MLTGFWTSGPTNRTLAILLRTTTMMDAVAARSGSSYLSYLLVGTIGDGDASSSTSVIDQQHDEEASYRQRLAHGASKASALLASNLSSALAPHSQSCLAYDDLPCECGSDGRLLGSAAAYILKWTKVAIKKTANAYLSSPLLLAFMPLLVGLIVGFGVGWWWFSGSRNVVVAEKKRSDGSGVNNRRSTDIRTTLLLFTTGINAILASGLHLIVSTLTNIIVNPMQYIASYMRGNKSEEDSAELAQREDSVRQHLKSDANSTRESGVPLSRVPKHIAVIMDGNRRYGRKRYGSATRGHWDGSKTLADFAKWSMAEGVQILTVYAFSTENWDRDPDEVTALMAIFVRYCEELRQEALVRGIRLQVLSTETARIPDDVAAGLKKMVEETAHCDKFLMNICLSYGSRGEIVNACQSIASDVQDGTLAVKDVTETTVQRRLLTGSCPDPDIVMRTSGEMRISNFLLWQMAYSEMFFVEKAWPELTKEDLVRLIQDFACGRQRRFGK